MHRFLNVIIHKTNRNQTKTNLLHSVSVPSFQYHQNTSNLLNITVMFVRCRHSLAVVTPNKYDRDLLDLTYALAKHKFFITEKLTNRALVTSTPVGLFCFRGFFFCMITAPGAFMWFICLILYRLSCLEEIYIHSISSLHIEMAQIDKHFYMKMFMNTCPLSGWMSIMIHNHFVSGWMWKYAKESSPVEVSWTIQNTLAWKCSCIIP